MEFVVSAFRFFEFSALDFMKTVQMASNAFQFSERKKKREEKNPSSLALMGKNWMSELEMLLDFETEGTSVDIRMIEFKQIEKR